MVSFLMCVVHSDLCAVPRVFETAEESRVKLLSV